MTAFNDLPTSFTYRGRHYKRKRLVKKKFKQSGLDWLKDVPMLLDVETLIHVSGKSMLLFDSLFKAGARFYSSVDAEAPLRHDFTCRAS